MALGSVNHSWTAPEGTPSQEGVEMRSRAILLTLSLLAGMATVGPEPVAGATPEERPDIIVILIDDMPGIDDRVLRRLPNIRTTFLEQGVRFTEFHGETPLCCPGRAGFLTGQHTHHHGVDKNTVRRFDPRMTIATQLDGAGYHTFHVGKYFNLYEAIAPRVPPGWDRFHALAPGKTGYAGLLRVRLLEQRQRHAGASGNARLGLLHRRHPRQDDVPSPPGTGG